MARDPDDGGAFVFDLVDDDAGDLATPLAEPRTDGGGDPDGDEPPPGVPPSGGLAAKLRALAPVAAVLAVVLGTGFAIDGVRDGARMERMRGVHGGVTDVSSPLEVTWTWEGVVGAPRSMEEGRWNEVAVLGDLLAFQSDSDLVALSPVTGEEAWRLGLGDDPDCGPLGAVGWNEQAVTQRLVCLSGSGADREALVVGADGAASTGRTLDVTDTRRYGEARPGPDGTVLRAKRVGPEPAASDAGDAECNSEGECTGTVEAGRDLMLRAEDAVTGEERWSVTVPFRSTRADQCINWSGTGWDGSTHMVGADDMPDADSFAGHITGELVRLSGCGVVAAVTSDGVLLGVEIEPGTGGVESLRTGGYLGYTFEPAPRTTLYDADGGVVVEIDGYALQPTAVDGSGPDTLIASGESGARIQAYELDGTLRWDVAAGYAHLFLAQAGGTAMLLTGQGIVRGLDLATGEEMWAWDGSDPDEGHPGDLYVSLAFTDGQSVLLVIENGYGGAELVALDAVTGGVVWEQSRDEASTDENAPGRSSGLVAVDGNLLEVAAGGVRGIG